jgi:hypothetical protein
MNGPIIGSVGYQQDAADDLNLTISVDFGQPNSVYQVFLVCGAAHALGCGFRFVGRLATDAVGRGTRAIVVPFAELEAAPFGAGYRTDHLDLLEGVGDLNKGILTAGALNYFVCRERVGHPQAEIPEAEAKAEAGDPLGASATDADPVRRR